MKIKINPIRDSEETVVLKTIKSHEETDARYAKVRTGLSWASPCRENGRYGKRIPQMMNNLKWGVFILLLGLVLWGGTACKKRSAPRAKEIGPPSKAIAYEPADRSTNVPVDQLLKWMPAKRATSYDIYFGTSNPPPFRATTDSTSCHPDTLDYRTTYFWRIDSKNNHGTTRGNPRIFTTRKK